MSIHLARVRQALFASTPGAFQVQRVVFGRDALASVAPSVLVSSKRWNGDVATNNNDAKSHTIDETGVVIGVHSGGSFTAAGRWLDEQTNGRLSASWKLSKLKGSLGEKLVVLLTDQTTNKIPPRVALVGLGEGEDSTNVAPLTPSDRLSIARIASAVGFKELKAVGAKKIAIEPLLSPRAAAEGSTLARVEKAFKDPKSNNNNKDSSKDKGAEIEIKPFDIEGNNWWNGSNVEEWTRGATTAEAQNFARRLAETPANLMTPTIFASTVQSQFANLENVNVIIRDEEWVKAKNMGCFLGVSKGSNEPPKFVEIHYKGANDDVAPLVLVGKGVTFDSGGISIKPSAGMAEMKADMTGAAAVVSSVWGAAKLKLPINIIALTPLCENMPSGHATKPGDVLTAMNGTTVEVDNTDAEGRLILADALTYAHELKPRAIIDVATLTGAIAIALGSEYIGVFASCNKLWSDLEEASKTSGESMWRMPLVPFHRTKIENRTLPTSFHKQMKSNVATIINSSKQRLGGSCTAATFLSLFALPKDKADAPIPWAHLDIAGGMSAESVLTKGMSGLPVRALMDYFSILIKSNK